MQTPGVEVDMEARALGGFGITVGCGASSLSCVGVAAVTGGGGSAARLEGLRRRYRRGGGGWMQRFEGVK